MAYRMMPRFGRYTRFITVTVAIAAFSTPIYVQQDNGPIASLDSSNCQTRVTDHFEIYYDPGLKDNLDRVESTAEAAYEMLSAEHDPPPTGSAPAAGLERWPT